MTSAVTPSQIQLPSKFEFLFKPWRYKVAHGGRGSSKSWSFARALVLMASQRPIRVLCTREFQNSIGDSVHRLIADQIFEMGLASYFEVRDKSIKSTAGAEFLFAGIRTNVTKIKSMEGIDICWVEEAETISQRSWEVLIPTIRKPGSEIWVSFNPDQQDDPTFMRFIKNQPPNACVMQVNWTDNPWFPEELRIEKDYLYSIDPEAAEHVWGGQCRTNGHAQIFRDRFDIFEFPTPVDPPPRFYHGLDFGFSNDPNAMVRCWITGTAPEEELWIDREWFGYKVEIDQMPKFMKDKFDTALAWPIKADSARPETISYLRRQGFNIVAAEKWGGSVEDGIAHLKGFRKIHIHSRCEHLRQEFRLYSYKIDKTTQEVLPIIKPGFDHGIDALRYALSGYIQRRGINKVWSKLAR